MVDEGREAGKEEQVDGDEGREWKRTKVDTPIPKPNPISVHARTRKHTHTRTAFQKVMDSWNCLEKWSTKRQVMILRQSWIKTDKENGQYKHCTSLIR